MAKLRVNKADNDFKEILGYKILNVGWMVVTILGEELYFSGKPIFAENADPAELSIVDVRSGIIIIPPLQPISLKWLRKRADVFFTPDWFRSLYF